MFKLLNEKRALPNIITKTEESKTQTPLHIQGY